MMKKIFSNIAFGVLALLATSCGLDNYEAPQSRLYGQVLYKDTNGAEHILQVKGTGEAVKLSLYQYGYQLTNNITVYTDQEARFEATLFDGEYHLIPNKNNGPWKTIQISEAKQDTIDFNLKGSTEVKVYVTPYFLITNASINLKDTILTASCEIEKVISDAKINTQSIFISPTRFVDESTNIVRFDYLDNKEAGNKSFSSVIREEKQLRALNDAKIHTGKVYARIGVKAEGADQFIYSDIKEISLK